RPLGFDPRMPPPSSVDPIESPHVKTRPSHPASTPGGQANPYLAAHPLPPNIKTPDQAYKYLTRGAQAANAKIKAGGHIMNGMDPLQQALIWAWKGPMQNGKRHGGLSDSVAPFDPTTREGLINLLTLAAARKADAAEVPEGSALPGQQ